LSEKEALAAEIAHFECSYDRFIAIFQKKFFFLNEC